MFLHIRFLVKSFPTKVARIRPCVTVNKEMRGKGAAPLESFPALRTLKIINNL